MTKDQEFIINIVADVVRQRSYYFDNTCSKVTEKNFYNELIHIIDDVIDKLNESE